MKAVDPVVAWMTDNITNRPHVVAVLLFFCFFLTCTLIAVCLGKLRCARWLLFVCRCLLAQQECVWPLAQMWSFSSHLKGVYLHINEKSVCLCKLTAGYFWTCPLTSKEWERNNNNNNNIEKLKNILSLTSLVHCPISMDFIIVSYY